MLSMVFSWVGAWLWVSVFDIFWVLVGLLFSVGFFGLRFPLCVCAHMARRNCCILEVVILLFCVVLDSGLCAQFLFCCVRCIMRSVSYC